MPSYTLSINRWHKVAERLSKAYTELSQSARNTYVNTQIAGYLGESQVERLRESAESEMQKLFRSFEIQDALIDLRRAIGEVNAKNGVALELAQYDALMRRHKLLEIILNSQTSDMVSLNEIAMLPNQIMGDGLYERSRSKIKVKVLENEHEDRLRKEAEALLAKAYALADRINDLNQERMTLELPEEMASVAGL
jgi:hypothetical protein